MKIPIGIVDDHQLFLKSLSLLLSGYDQFEVVLEALNGKVMQAKLKETKTIPRIMLIDVNMPVMDGESTARWLSTNYSEIKLVALSMNDAEKSIISMIKAGCCSYLLKDSHPDELEKALLEIHQKGYYNNDLMNVNYRKLFNNNNKEKPFNISDREIEFLELVCSDLTYKEIAIKMEVSERTVDGYREVLFNKLNVHSRVGLALECVRRGYIKL